MHALKLHAPQLHMQHSGAWRLAESCIQCTPLQWWRRDRSAPVWWGTIGVIIKALPVGHPSVVLLRSRPPTAACARRYAESLTHELLASYVVRATVI